VSFSGMDGRGARAVVEDVVRRQQAGDDTFLDDLVAVDMVNHAAGPQGRSGLAAILRTIDHDLGPVTRSACPRRVVRWRGASSTSGASPTG
jgi:hypothetical protein